MPKTAVCGAMNADLIGIHRSLFRPGDSIPGTVTVRAGGAGQNIAEAPIRPDCSVSMHMVPGEDDRCAIQRAFAEHIGPDLSGSGMLAGERSGSGTYRRNEKKRSPLLCGNRFFSFFTEIRTDTDQTMPVGDTYVFS